MKQRINFTLSIIAFIAILTSTIGVTLVYYNLFQEQVKSDLRLSAQLLMETEVFQDAYAGAGNDRTQLDTSPLNKLNVEKLRITWIDQDGTVLYDNDTNAENLSNHLDRPEIIDAIKNGEGEGTRRSDTMNMNTFNYALLLEDGTILRVSIQAINITSVFVAALPVICAIAVVILLICIFIGHLLTRRLLRPIETMAENLDDQVDAPIYKELEPFSLKIRSQHENVLAAAKSRQDFTANISHELKTPITAINGYAELIENKMVDEDSQIHIAKQIRGNSDRLLSLINDIIKLSELDHSELPRNFGFVDLYDISKECCENMRVSAESKNIEIVCKGQSSMVNADVDLLKELIENLIDNAIRYNNENGHVWVDISMDNGHAVLKVKDDGIGIPLDQQDRIFERFYRVDKSRSRETGGTGLGLAIVKHIAEIHNAEIIINSNVGEGTEITVSF